jgi:FkbM family methyltransferase
MPVVRKAVIGCWNAYTRALKPRFSVEQRMGIPLLLDRHSHLDRALLVRGSWERDQIAELTALCQRHRENSRHSVFLDVGAYAGLYSILLQKTGLFDDILAFEPDPISSAQLRGNLFLNQVVGAVQVIEAAVTARSGSVTFHRAEDRRRVESGLDVDSNDAERISSFDVKAVRLDEVLDTQDSFVAAKIDIEGHELQALEGMAGVLARNRCVLQVESFEVNAPRVVAFMGDRGYRVAQRIRDDYFFVPSER